jgi:hypothetical protein
MPIGTAVRSSSDDDPQTFRHFSAWQYYSVALDE